MANFTLSVYSYPLEGDGNSGTVVDARYRQFDSSARAQNSGGFYVIATQKRPEHENRNRTRNTLYMLKTQKPLSWFLLAFLAEHGRRYSTDFDACRYWFLTSQPCCGGRNRTGVWRL